ncbi:hypothetical protein QF021_003639 [Acidovorax delafieldii]|uniref:hypothetical protein n=1 Tax=Acidovorax delafieldii TaxID=47920 RepID=UPI00285F402D|nr:hypothetical protein [Acidovorax delafieldii]MDR6155550.1 hypothetical protein [Acidovorax delafieldii]
MPSSKTSQRTAQALQRVAGMFEAKGWRIQASKPGSTGPDLVVRRRGKRYGVVLKATSEGRADRVIPLLSQAVLEARAYALQSRGFMPLAVLHVDHAPRALVANVMAYAREFAAEVAVGFVSVEGVSEFRGEGLEGLNVSAPFRPRQVRGTLIRTDNLLSDLNQWMLKVLLAPELPEGMLNAPRGRYRNGVELARAAQVSAMTASRFLQQLRRERFLLESEEFLTLVQREELFERWSSVAPYGTTDLPARFLVNIQIEDRVRELLNKVEGDACLGLFAAADGLRVGHVSGVPRYICVRHMPRFNRASPGSNPWSALLPFPREAPHVLLRVARFPESTFRGAVRRDGVMVADVIQVWLDVLNHPTRGQEQAEHIFRKVLLPLV